MWFYQTLGQEFGPLPWEDIVELNSSGVLDGQDLVRSEDTSKWLPFEEVQRRVTGVGPKEVPLASRQRETKETETGSSEATGAKWHYRDGQDEHGPFSLSELVAKATAGDVSASSEVRFGTGAWRKAGTIGQLMAAIPFTAEGKNSRKPPASRQVVTTPPQMESPAATTGLDQSIEHHDGPIGEWGNFEQGSSQPTDGESTEENWLAGIPAEGRASLPEMESLDDLMSPDEKSVLESSGETLDLSDEEADTDRQTVPRSRVPDEWLPELDSEDYSLPYRAVSLEEVTSLDEIWSPSRKGQGDGHAVEPVESPQPASTNPSNPTPSQPKPVVGVKKLKPRKTTSDLSNVDSEGEPASSQVQRAARSDVEKENDEKGVGLPKASPLPSHRRRNSVKFTLPSFSFLRLEMASLINWKLISAILVLAAVLVWQFVPWADVFADDQASHAKLIEIFSGYRRAAAQPDEAKWEAFAKKAKGDCESIAKEIQKGMSYPRDSRRLLLQVAKNSIPKLIRRCRNGKCPEVAQTEYLLNRAAWLMKLPGATEPQPISLLEESDAKK